MQIFLSPQSGDFGGGGRTPWAFENIFKFRAYECEFPV